MTKSRGILPERQYWNEVQLKMLRELYPNNTAQVCAIEINRPVSSIYAKANELGIAKSEAFKASAASGRLDGVRSAGTRFKKGHKTWNKGTHFTAGGRSAETRFKKGRKPEEARNYQPIGSLRINADGHLERKVSDDQNIYPARRWTPVYRLVWEQANGHIPVGFFVVFKQGMKTNELELITSDKLELVDRAENMRRNSYHNNYPKEVAQLIQLRGAVKRKINRRIKDERNTTTASE